MALDDLRAELTAIDNRLIELVAERQRIVARISGHKLDTGTATRDYQREKEVIEGGRQRAQTLGLNPALAESILTLLIRSSLTSQERARMAAEAKGGGKRALVIGGAGKMGAWFADFLASGGYAVTIADPNVDAESPFENIGDWQSDSLDQELILVAAPLGTTASVLDQLATRNPPGVIIDIGSLKSPLRKPLQRLVDTGCRVASIHPMFGPDTQLLSGRHVITIDLGVKEATDAAMELFSSTMAEQFVMGLEEHDRLIAYVLGLSHALNVAFFTALAESGELVPRLAQMSSTTFDAQLDVAALVAKDNPRMYFEIQALNEFGSEALTALVSASERIKTMVESGDEAGFVGLMHAGRRYMASRD